MANLNKVQLMGNLTKHNEERRAGETLVINNGIAVNRKYRRKDGATVEEVDFFNFVIFGPAAETFAKYTGQGDSVYLEGRLKTERWEVDGQKRSSIKVIVDNFQFLKTKGGDRAPENAPRPATAAAPASDVQEEQDVPFWE